MIWLIILPAAIAVIAFATRPLWARRASAPSQAAHDVRVFKRQLEEIEKDVARGTISSAEAEGARREVSRRLLAAAEAADAEALIAPAPEKTSRGAIWIAALPFVIGAGVVYVAVGAPHLPDKPLATRDLRAEAKAQQITQAAAERLAAQYAAENPAPTPELPDTPEGMPSFQDLVRRMEIAVEQRPQDAEGRVILAQAYIRLDRLNEAWPLLRDAVELLGPAAGSDLIAHQGETMVLAGAGYVSQEAEDVFLRAPAEPVSRYFLALAQEQRGEVTDALAAWSRMLSEYPHSGFTDMLVRQIRDSAQRASLNPAPYLQVAGALPPGGAADGRAAAALEQELGLPPAELLAADRGGPTPEGVEAVMEMSPEERIAFMENRADDLFERLKQQPNDLSGWTMLIRSFGQLNRSEDAASAYELAKIAFLGDAAALQALAQTAQDAGLEP